MFKYILVLLIFGGGTALYFLFASYHLKEIISDILYLIKIYKIKYDNNYNCADNNYKFSGTAGSESLVNFPATGEEVIFYLLQFYRFIPRPKNNSYWKLEKHISSQNSFTLITKKNKIKIGFEQIKPEHISGRLKDWKNLKYDTLNKKELDYIKSAGYDFGKNCKINYLTIKNGDEIFAAGGLDQAGRLTVSSDIGYIIYKGSAGDYFKVKIKDMFVRLSAVLIFFAISIYGLFIIITSIFNKLLN